MKWLRKFCPVFHDIVACFTGAPPANTYASFPLLFVESATEADKIIAVPDPDYRDAKIVELEKEVAELIDRLMKAQQEVVAGAARLLDLESRARTIKREETEADLLLLCARTAIDIILNRGVVMKEQSEKINDLKKISAEPGVVRLSEAGQQVGGFFQPPAGNVLAQLGYGYRQQQGR